ncbi:MAG TPA: dTDP-4-dehydrorhamnose 3,5-epimerase family protein [Candidatus Saccharimonadales bacterium]|nr:dTDP-4-dehydrorhamnose 3,5-epimerase family protein [Candidatus Saccharimonadales bacterium]
MALPTTEVKGRTTPIPGLLIFDVSRVGDERGYFQEKFQRQKLMAAGLPADFVIVQNNISYNHESGVTRGIHAEPWEKYVSVVSGRAFAAWVDLRKGETFGQTYYTELNPEVTAFVPRGVANSYQALEQDVIYSYLVNDHWSAEGKYQSVNMFDPELAIPWPLSKDQAVVSERDLNHPLLKDVTPMEF